MDLDGKRALVTGSGVVGGIGAAIAQRLIAEGAEVVITDHDDERGRETAASLEGAAGFVAAELADPASVRGLAAEVGAVDVLVNNAALFTVAPTLEQELESLDEALAVNVRAPFILSAALVPGMLARGGGSIVNVTSMAAHIGMSGLSVYGATKAAVESLTRTWAAEFGTQGVRVNAVAPGPTRSAKVLASAPEAGEAIGRSTPLQRQASIEEIAEVVAFLAGPRSTYVTGAVIHADGGRTAV